MWFKSKAEAKLQEDEEFYFNFFGIFGLVSYE